MKHIFSNIRAFRELKCLTREYVAAQLDITPSGYGKIERGEVDIQLSRLEQIAEVFGVDVLTLIEFDTGQFFEFNMQNNTSVQAPGAIAKTMNFYSNNIQDKYIAYLEREIERLRNELDKKL